MRTLIWMFVSTLLTATAIHGLDMSSRPPAWAHAPASVEIQPGCVDSGEHGDVEPPQYTR